MGQHQQFAPGMRLEIRDAEWRLTRLDHSSDGGYLLGCTGLSELVRGREAQYLSKLEDAIRTLDPATTELVGDLSQGYRAGLLKLATQLRDTAPPTSASISVTTPPWTPCPFSSSPPARPWA